MPPSGREVAFSKKMTEGARVTWNLFKLHRNAGSSTAYGGAPSRREPLVRPEPIDSFSELHLLTPINRSLFENSRRKLSDLDPTKCRDRRPRRSARMGKAKRRKTFDFIDFSYNGPSRTPVPTGFNFNRLRSVLVEFVWTLQTPIYRSP